jgi:hypothetical protein
MTFMPGGASRTHASTTDKESPAYKVEMGTINIHISIDRA